MRSMISIRQGPCTAWKGKLGACELWAACRCFHSETRVAVAYLEGSGRRG